jgi:hypothetical protein
MKLFSWLRGNTRPDDNLAEWRQAWQRAIDTPHDGDVVTLRRELEEASPPDADVEIELEMLEALEQLRHFQQNAASDTLPVIETQHRMVAAETCHFSAPASAPDEAAQTSGRVLITPTRIVFVGAGRTQVTAWHAVRDVVRMARDVAFVRADRTAAAQFRFNSYTDAVVTAFLAAHFKDARRPRL